MRCKATFAVPWIVGMIVMSLSSAAGAYNVMVSIAGNERSGEIGAVPTIVQPLMPSAGTVILVVAALRPSHPGEVAVKSLRLEGNSTLFCSSPPPPPGASISDGSPAQRTTADYTTPPGGVTSAGEARISLPLDVGKSYRSCTSVPFDSFSATFHVLGTLVDSTSIQGPDIVISMRYPTIVAQFSNIDDNVDIWVSKTGPNDTAICRLETGRVPRSGQCDVTTALRRRSITNGTLIIKIGNGGCGNSHGDIVLFIEGQEKWHGHKGDTGTFTHCGWTYRAVVSLSILTGSTKEVEVKNCFNVGDCEN